MHTIWKPAARAALTSLIESPSIIDACGSVSSCSAACSNGIGGFVECLPRRENFVELDPHVVDAWGIPALRIHMTWGSNEKALFQDALDAGAEMLEAAGAKDVTTPGVPKTPGDGIHEVGTARMGSDPRNSVLDSFCRTHDVKNLFVTDGACYPSMGTVNPTLTFMALTVRACDSLIEQARRGDLA